MLFLLESVLSNKMVSRRRSRGRESRSVIPSGILSFKTLEFMLVSGVLIYAAHSIMKETDPEYEEYFNNLKSRYESSSPPRDMSLDFWIFIIVVSVLFSLMFSGRITGKNSGESAVYGGVMGAIVTTTVFSIISIVDLTFPIKSGILLGVSGVVIGIFLTVWAHFRA